MQLFPHQQEAKLFLLSRRRAILADQPRVGKTLPTAAAALENLPALIVCPAIAKTVWEAAFNKLAPNVSVHVVNGKREAGTPTSATPKTAASWRSSCSTPRRKGCCRWSTAKPYERHAPVQASVQGRPARRRRMRR